MGAAAVDVISAYTQNCTVQLKRFELLGRPRHYVRLTL